MGRGTIKRTIIILTLVVCALPFGFAESDESGQEGQAEGAPAGDSSAQAADETQMTFESEDDADAGTAAENGEPSAINSLGVWDFVRMILVLGVVIAAIYVVFYLLKRASGGRLENSPIIRVLGSRALPGNKGLHLIEVGRQVFLIGVGDDSIALVSEISDQESLDELRLSASAQAPPSRGSFADMLSGFFHAGGARSSPRASDRAAGGPRGGESGAEDSGGESRDGRSRPGEGSGGGPARPSGNGGQAASFFESQKERLRKLR